MELIRQVMDFSGADEAAARKALERHPNNVERAINAILEGELDHEEPPAEASSWAGWSGTAPPPTQMWGSVGAPPPDESFGNSITQGLQNAPYATQRGAQGQGEPPPYQSSAGEPGRPIDLTNLDPNEDEDFRRALAQSLAEHDQEQRHKVIRSEAPFSDESTVAPAKEQALVPVPTASVPFTASNNDGSPTAPNRPDVSEDEQLQRAVAESMGMAGAGYGKTWLRDFAELPPALKLGAHSRRRQGAPMALAAPLPALSFVPLVLQTLFAAPPIRQAFSHLAMADDRAADLTDYWKGKSPVGQGHTSRKHMESLDPFKRDSVDVFQRLQMLFAFMNNSNRAACIVGDLIPVIPGHVLNTNSSDAPWAEVVHRYYESICDSYLTAVQVNMETSDKHARLSGNDISSNEGREKLVVALKRIVQSRGCSALSKPSSPSSSGVVPLPGSCQEASSLEVEADSVNTDVQSALHAFLAKDGSLITELAEVLCLAIRHLPQTLAPGEKYRPFELSKSIWADRYMWDKRRGLRLDAELESEEIAKMEKLVAQLRDRWTKLSRHLGQDTLDLLRTSMRYFEESAQKSDDQVRNDAQREAGPQLRKVFETLENEIKEIDEQLVRGQVAVAQQRRIAKEAAQSQYDTPEMKTMRYDLKAVLMHDGLSGPEHVWAYVQHEERWWRVCQGEAQEVPEETVLTDRSGSDLNAGVFWVCYARVRSEEELLLKNPSLNDTIESAIADDNSVLDSELLSLTTDTEDLDATMTPARSSTDELQKSPTTELSQSSKQSVQAHSHDAAPTDTIAAQGVPGDTIMDA